MEEVVSDMKFFAQKGCKIAKTKKVFYFFSSSFFHYINKINKTYHSEFDSEPEDLEDINGAEVVHPHGKKKKKKKNSKKWNKTKQKQTKNI